MGTDPGRQWGQTPDVLNEMRKKCCFGADFIKFARKTRILCGIVAIILIGTEIFANENDADGDRPQLQWGQTPAASGDRPQPPTGTDPGSKWGQTPAADGDRPQIS